MSAWESGRPLESQYFRLPIPGVFTVKTFPSRGFVLDRRENGGSLGYLQGARVLVRGGLGLLVVSLGHSCH